MPNYIQKNLYLYGLNTLSFSAALLGSLFSHLGSRKPNIENQI